MAESMIRVSKNLPDEADAEFGALSEQGKTLYITPDTTGLDFRTLLGQVTQYVNMGAILAEIKAGTQFVIRIPTEYQPAYESGRMFIMKNQTSGKMWPTLMKIAENGRQQVVTPLPMAEQAVFQGNPVQELANGYHNLLMQKQIAKLTAAVEETYRLVERIEHGQMDDRIAKLEAGKNGLLLAMTMPEGDERDRQFDSSRQSLLEAQSQIGRALKRCAEEFETVPKSASRRFLREMRHSGYLAGKQQEVLGMQEYYELYMQSTKLLAASYAVCGNFKTAETSFRLGEEFIRTIDFSKVQTIGHIHKNISDMFYLSPAEYIAAERESCLEDAACYDYVALEVSGEELLEVLKDDEAKTVPKAGPKQ